MTDKSIKEQERKFWEWCGVKPPCSRIGGCLHELLDFKTSCMCDDWHYPSIDLNNLWEYAVPKALGILAERGYIPPIMKLFQLWYDELVSLTGDSSSVEQGALALFWALWQVKEEGK